MIRMVLALAIVARFQIARAHESQVTPSRYRQITCSGVSFNKHWPAGAVPIYVNTSSTYGVHLLHKSAGTPWTTAEFVGQLQIALSKFNNNIGANIRPYYAGTTQQTLVSGGIVVRSSPTPQSDTAFGDLNASCTAPNRGHATSGFVIANRIGAGGAARIFSGFDFDTSAASGAKDVHILFQHELGHALGLEHSDLAILFDNLGFQYQASSRTPMNSIDGSNLRHWTKYEKDTLRALYGTRTGVFRFLQSGPGKGYGTNWSTVSAISPVEQTPSGIGGMTQLAHGVRYGWNGLFSPQVRTQLRTHTSTYSVSNGDSSRKALVPPSVSFGGGEYRAFWIESDPPASISGFPLGRIGDYAPGFEQKRIFWMKSNDGITWTQHGPLQDPVTGNVITTFTDSISAGYDPLRKVFQVTWIDDMYNGRYFTLPGPGSLQTQNGYSLFPTKMWDAPSIACSNVLNGCIAVAVGRPSTVDPILLWMKGGTDTAGEWNHIGYQLQASIPQTQSPSIAFQPLTGRYTITYVSRDGASVYVSNLQAGDLAWPVPSSAVAFFPGYALSPPRIGMDLGISPTFVSHAVIGVVRYGP